MDEKRLRVQQWISSVYSPYNEANEAKLLKDKLLAEVTQKINNVHQMNNEQDSEVIVIYFIHFKSQERRLIKYVLSVSRSVSPCFTYFSKQEYLREILQLV